MTGHLLERKAFEAARQFIYSSARPLEIARFEHAFLRGAVDPVLDALRKFQNPDGGFGHALEPDLRAQESSALCTTIAFQILRSTQEMPDQDCVTKGINFFLQTLDRAEAHWRIIPTSAEQCPHAPWWNQTGRESEFDRFSLNPTAEILGYLYDYQQFVPKDILQLVSGRVLGCLSALQEIEMHDLLCCLRLLKTKALPAEMREPVTKKLIELVPGIVAIDPDEWSGYSLRPLQVVDEPTSPFMPGLEDALEKNLDYEISMQNEDGSWTPTWSWGMVYPEDWKIAQKEWSGIITFDKLLTLKKFSRIEGIS